MIYTNFLVHVRFIPVWSDNAWSIWFLVSSKLWACNGTVGTLLLVIEGTEVDVLGSEFIVAGWGVTKTGVLKAAYINKTLINLSIY